VQAAAKKRRQEQESEAEYIRRRVAVAQKAYCIISASREYTYIFKVRLRSQTHGCLVVPAVNSARTDIVSTMLPY
jgi:hypothetical protein